MFLFQMSSLEISLNILYLIKQDANKQRVNGHFFAFFSLYLTFQGVVKYKKLFTNAQKTATLILVDSSNSM